MADSLGTGVVEDEEPLVRCGVEQGPQAGDPVVADCGERGVDLHGGRADPDRGAVEPVDERVEVGGGHPERHDVAGLRTLRGREGDDALAVSACADQDLGGALGFVESLDELRDEALPAEQAGNVEHRRFDQFAHPGHVHGVGSGEPGDASLHSRSRPRLLLPPRGFVEGAEVVLDPAAAQDLDDDLHGMRVVEDVEDRLRGYVHAPAVQFGQPPRGPRAGLRGRARSSPAAT